VNACQKKLSRRIHTQAKYVRLFALDVGGQQGHDQYVYLVPNGLAIVGLAPSHVLLHAYQHNSATELPQEQHRVSSTPADLGKHGALASAAAEHGVATSASGALHKSPDHGEQQGMQQPMSSVSVTMEQKQVGSDPASTRQGSDQLQAEESGSSRLQPSLLLCLDGPSLCCMQQQQQQQQIIVKAPAKDLLTLQGPQVLQKPEDVRQPKRHKGPSEPGATLPFPPDQLVSACHAQLCCCLCCICTSKSVTGSQPGLMHRSHYGSRCGPHASRTFGLGGTPKTTFHPLMQLRSGPC